MRISTKGRYALRIMTDLAKNGKDNYVSLKDVSARQGVSVKYLEKIIAKLNRAGYLNTQRGTSGGYKLAKDPSEYSIGDILRATEGDLSPTDCVSNDSKCNLIGKCKTYTFWKGLDDAITDYVNSKTLKDLV